MKIKPLARPGFTMFNNYVIDYFMPDLSGSGWKVLSFAIRKTIGWVDEETESGRKERDRISYTQFLEGTGIGSKTTLSKAIKECLEKGYLLREPNEEHSQAFDYMLNKEFEIEVEETGTETVPVGSETGTETVLVGSKTGTETVLETGTETVHTKEKGKKEGGDKFLFYQTEEGVRVEI